MKWKQIGHLKVEQSFNDKVAIRATGSLKFGSLAHWPPLE